MSVRVKGAIAALIIAVAIGILYRANVYKLPANKSPVGFKILDQMERQGVPDFSLERLDGSTLKLSDLKGKILIINFWASWCNPCVEEFPSMIKLIEEFKDEVVIVAVSTDETKNDIESFAKAFGLPKAGFEIVWDKEKAIMDAYGVQKIPESFIVGRDFKLLRKVLGIEDWASPGAFDYFRLLAKGESASEVK